MCLKAQGYLFKVIFFLCQLRQFFKQKVIRFRGFRIGDKGTAHQITQDKDLAYTVGVDRPVMPVSVLHCDESYGYDVQTR